MTRDALSWALSATVAGAAHLGLALFILDRIPPSAPPPPETEIMVDMIKVGQAQAQQPAQASAAAEAATGAAVEAQADSADAAQADRAEAAESETAQAAETDSAASAARETASAAAETDSTAAQPEQPVADRAAEQAQQAAATPTETAQSATRQQDTGPAPTAEPASAVQARAATTPRQTVATEAARTVRTPSPPSARAAPAASNQRIITGIAEADIPQKAAATPLATTPTPSTSLAPTTSAAAVLAPAPSPPPATTIAPSPSGGASTVFSPAPSAQTGTVSAVAVPSATAAPSTAPAATVSAPSAPAAPAAAQVLEDKPATPAAQALSVSRVPAFVERAVAEPTDQVRYGAIVEYLRDYRADAACFAALPTVSGVSGAVELDTFGLQSETLASFTEGLAREAGLTPTTYQREITAAQCAALRFVTGLRDYPAFSLTIDLEQRDIPQQGYLIGDIRHFGDRIVHLLLVDDAGNVLVLDGFLRDQDAAQHFEVGPLTQTVEGVVTQQLLFALALPDTLPVLEAAVSAGAMPAEKFFARLATELTPELEAATGLGLVAFAVGENYAMPVCTHTEILSVTESDIEIEGYSTTAEPFIRMLADVQRDNGIQPSIGVRIVTNRQCPAVTFLHQLARTDYVQPKLSLDSDVLASGSVLTGQITDVNDREIWFILVDQHGRFYDITGLLLPRDDGSYRFGIQLQGASENAEPQPQMLIAVASDRPLETRTTRTERIDDITALLQAEIAQKGIKASASAAYFRLQNE